MAANRDWGVTQRRPRSGSDTSTETDRDLLLNTANSRTSTPTNFCKCCSCKVLLPPTVRSSTKDLQNVLKIRSDEKVHISNSPYKDELSSQLLIGEDEALASLDKIESMKTRARQILDILKTIDLYSRYLDDKFNLSFRLQTKLINITGNCGNRRQDASKGHVTRSASSQLLNDISALSFDHCEIPDDIIEMMSDFGEKHRNFVGASRNFCGILRHNTKLSDSQFKKISHQFEAIRAEYFGRKTITETHLNDLIASRMYVLKKCVQSLATIFNQKMEDDRQMFKLLNEMKFESVETLMKVNDDEKHYSKSEHANDSIDQVCTRTHIQSSR